MSEDDFKSRVIETARLNGWRVHHSRPARLPNGKWVTPLQGDAGLPDLVLARNGVVLLAELKTDTGSVTPEQRKWLAAAGPHGRLWRPRDWSEILSELSRRATATPGATPGPPPCCHPHSTG